MKRFLSYTFLWILLCLGNVDQLFAQKNSRKIVVAKKGKADFRTIQGAINSLPDSSASMRTIYVKNGVYREKVYLEKNMITIEGESREKTILTAAIARDEWRCLHNDDWGVATLNIDANDIGLLNISVINSYGLDHPNEKMIDCPQDSVTGKKSIRAFGHQMAVRTMNATRLKAINCIFRAYAGDTVSPWNVDNGMFYFKDCIIEGGVDFYCPRGWAYAENCTFIHRRGDAAIWHDGSKHEDSKTVLVNCNFEGYDGFKLGRYHRDAQFYLINCSFADNMADKAIYRVPTNNTIRWGERIYYYNCNRKAGNFAWFANNLHQAPNAVAAKDINTQWVFGNRWNPLSN